MLAVRQAMAKGGPVEHDERGEERTLCADRREQIPVMAGDTADTAFSRHVAEHEQWGNGLARQRRAESLRPPQGRVGVDSGDAKRVSVLGRGAVLLLA
jgi:hypothetical protein